jgi:hypothetical protein
MVSGYLVTKRQALSLAAVDSVSQVRCFSVLVLGCRDSFCRLCRLLNNSGSAYRLLCRRGLFVKIAEQEQLYRCEMSRNDNLVLEFSPKVVEFYWHYFDWARTVYFVDPTLQNGFLTGC